jgi:type VII secretion integral membrane protein EccD
MNGTERPPGHAGGPPPAGARTGLCRVTVTHAGRRVDLTLPTDLPVAAFLGELAGLCGARLDGEQPAPLFLSRLAAGPIHPARTLAQAGVVDGDVLVLTERPVEAPRVVDDLGRAVADAVARRPGRWDRDSTTAALRLGAGLLGAVAAGFLGAGWRQAGRPPPVLPALVVVALVGLAATTSRASGSRMPPPMRGAMLLAAVPWGALTGAAVAGGLDGGLARAGTLASGGAGAALAALAVAAADRGAAPQASAMAVAATAIAAAAAALPAGLGAERAGSVIVTAALACLLLLPRVAVRASGVLHLDDGTVEDEVATRVDAGRYLLAWLAGGLSAAFLVGAALLAWSPGPAGRALALVAAGAVGLRARTFRFVAEAAAPITAAGLALAGTGAAAVTDAAGPLAAAGLAGAAGLAAAVLAASVRRATLGPGAGKAVEVLELACLIAVVPAATVSTGALAAVRAVAAALAGGP